MMFEKYIQIKNLMRLFQVYETPFVDDNTVGKTRYDASEKLLIAMCELEAVGKYPISSDLVDLITFVNDNYEARSLSDYLNKLHSYDHKLLHNQNSIVFSYHNLIEEALYQLPTRYSTENFINCDINFKAEYIMREKGVSNFLDVTFNSFKVTVERDHTLDSNTYIINDVVFENLKFSEMINVINYARFVKDLDLKTIQAAYYFLR